MGDTILKWLLNHKGWLAALVITFLLLIIPSIVYEFMTIDSEIWDNQRFAALQTALKKEQAELPRPDRTAINSTDAMGKSFWIRLSTRYRTELSNEEFREVFDNRLAERGWIYIEQRNEYGTPKYVYCRGKLDAELIDEGDLGRFGDGGNYWKLSFVAGRRTQSFWSFPFLRKSAFPIACQ